MIRHVDTLQKLYARTMHSSGCLLWTGKRYPNGYGALMRGGKWKLAHRVSWELHNGEIPEGLYVCHRCDVAACVNPEHLFLGTPADNTADMLAKKRNRPCRGEAAGKARLTEAAVMSIRASVDAGALHKTVARAFGISRKQVSVIVNRLQWAHI